MGRAKRLVTDDGKLFCIICQRWVHIRDYRTREVLNDSLVSDIWYVSEHGRKFGRPDGYCRQCSAKKTQGKDAVARWQEEVGVDRTRHKDRWTAEQDYKDQKAKEEWVPPAPVSADVMAAEMERLTRLYGPPD